MRFQVIVHPEAHAEIDEIVGWIAERSPTAAARWHRGLHRAIRSLSRFPKRWPLAPENDEDFVGEIRHLLYGKRLSVYRVLFSVRGDTVHVLHVRHGARRPLGSPDLEDEDSNQD